mmetsp:Transcript_13698/g.33725  ORF Transcript_13698/g.33725 Transcript_13698/m.33725 type:complete len:707 (-) Transcript_13698:139-2259(-)
MACPFLLNAAQGLPKRQSSNVGTGSKCPFGFGSKAQGEETERQGEAPAAACPYGFSSAASAGPKLSSLHCILCKTYLFQCVSVQPCGHKFCKGCISRWRDCPVCGQDISDVKPDQHTLGLVDQFLAAHSLGAGAQAAQPDSPTADASTTAPSTPSLEGQLAQLVSQVVGTSSPSHSSPSPPSTSSFFLHLGLAAMAAGNTDAALARLEMCKRELLREAARQLSNPPVPASTSTSSASQPSAAAAAAFAAAAAWEPAPAVISGAAAGAGAGAGARGGEAAVQGSSGEAGAEREGTEPAGAAAPEQAAPRHDNRPSTSSSSDGRDHSLVAEHKLLVLSNPLALSTSTSTSSQQQQQLPGEVTPLAAGPHASTPTATTASATTTAVQPAPLLSGPLSQSDLQALPASLATQLGSVFGSQADCCMRAGDGRSAAALYASSIVVLEPPATSSSAHAEALHALCVSINKLGDLYYRTQDLPSARSAYESALAHRRARAGTPTLALVTHAAAHAKAGSGANGCPVQGSGQKHALSAAQAGEVLDVAASLIKVGDVCGAMGAEIPAAAAINEAQALVEGVAALSHAAEAAQDAQHAAEARAAAAARAAGAATAAGSEGSKAASVGQGVAATAAGAVNAVQQAAQAVAGALAGGCPHLGGAGVGRMSGSGGGGGSSEGRRGSGDGDQGAGYDIVVARCDHLSRVLQQLHLGPAGA